MPPDRRRRRIVHEEIQNILRDAGMTGAYVRRRTLLKAMGVGAALLLYGGAEAYLRLCRNLVDQVTRTHVTPFQVAPGDFHHQYWEVEFPSSQASRGTLRGWLLGPEKGHLEAGRPAPTNQSEAVVFVHGRDSNRTSGAAPELARRLLAAGYWVLLFDLSGWGESDGHRMTMGDGERWDVLGAHRFMTGPAMFDPRNLKYHGDSMGGAALLAVSEEMPYSAIVTDSAFGELAGVLQDEIDSLGLPALLVPGLRTALREYGIDPDFRPIDAVARQPHRRLIIMHPWLDPVVRFAQAVNLLNAGGRHSLPSAQQRVTAQDLADLGDLVAPVGTVGTELIHRRSDTAQIRRLVAFSHAGHLGATGADIDTYMAELLAAFKGVRSPRPRGVGDRALHHRSYAEGAREVQ